MAVSYTKLWKLLLNKKLKKTDLIPIAGISSNIVAKLGKNDYVSLESLEKISRALDCNIGDIVELDLEDNNVEEK